MASERRNWSTVSSGESCGRLSNHFGAISSALAPTDMPLPSTSISARTKACTADVIVTAPNRNGLAKETGRSNSEISRTANRGGMIFPLP